MRCLAFAASTNCRCWCLDKLAATLFFTVVARRMRRCLSIRGSFFNAISPMSIETFGLGDVGGCNLLNHSHTNIIEHFHCTELLDGSKSGTHERETIRIGFGCLAEARLFGISRRNASPLGCSTGRVTLKVLRIAQNTRARRAVQIIAGTTPSHFAHVFATLNRHTVLWLLKSLCNTV